MIYLPWGPARAWRAHESVSFVRAVARYVRLPWCRRPVGLVFLPPPPRLTTRHTPATQSQPHPSHTPATLQRHHSQITDHNHTRSQPHNHSHNHSHATATPQPHHSHNHSHNHNRITATMAAAHTTQVRASFEGRRWVCSHVESRGWRVAGRAERVEARGPRPEARGPRPEAWSGTSWCLASKRRYC